MNSSLWYPWGTSEYSAETEMISQHCKQTAMERELENAHMYKSRLLATNAHNKNVSNSKVDFHHPWNKVQDL